MTEPVIVKIKDWVAALRSGSYSQTAGALRTTTLGTEDLYKSYCCLGVACELAGAFLPEENTAVFISTGDIYVEDSGLLSGWAKDDLNAAVKDWATYCEEFDSQSFQDRLAGLNDSGDWTFNDIADFIEEWCDVEKELRF